MMRMMHIKATEFLRGCIKSVALSSIAIIAAGSASVAQEHTQGKWNYGLNFYLWAPGVEGTAFNGQNLDVSFSDIVDNLDFGVMGSLVARKDKLAWFIDGIYLKASNSTSGPLAGPLLAAGVEIEAAVFTGGIGYNHVYNQSTTITPFVGARALVLDATLNLNIGGALATSSPSSDYFDGLIGVRGRTQIADQWALTFYADVGTGDSDVTWQVLASVNYQLENWDLSFGYRHVEWDLGAGQPIPEMSISGPFIGGLYRF